MFERQHHRTIAALLEHLDGDLLADCHCLFGGGTAMALRHGEYRESVDVDFLVADQDGFRRLRSLVTASVGLSALVREGMPALAAARDIRADQYGIRTAVVLADAEIKFEIVREGRIALSDPVERICGVPLLTSEDMTASKLLANSDRGMDDGTFNRDIIDLAMMSPATAILEQGVAKAIAAYGDAIVADVGKAILRLRERAGWLERCMQVMAMRQPKAVVWQRLRTLHRRFEAVAGR